MYRWPQNLPNGHKIYQMAGKLIKWPQNRLTFSIARPSKICPNWDFWFENMPSGNPGLDTFVTWLFSKAASGTFSFVKSPKEEGAHCHARAPIQFSERNLLNGFHAWKAKTELNHGK
jgi:hypothetical protein